MVARPDGRQVIKVQSDGPVDAAWAVGQELAKAAIAQGAARLLVDS